jgi:serine/threonine protein kinase
MASYRDLKPQNVGFDEYDCVKIFDFGLAREHSVDAEGRNLAKPRLMSGGAGTPR